ncbi:pitrilysin family protein [Dehalococcoides mccartyi]|uniref:M16 family metallopeptidase n=1 Tax=Dehalococcoides mccartyi TaxID=61435 RepID=UPI0003C8670D|nr:pitrilysin family protein [Dehalococcoides mccartyi]AHB14038.1 peptidase, M16 family [Dehalococcoides mccartyi GY50]AII58380.1 peptidase M16 [Dehalococcoides mccartyi CG1]APH12953.1 peptidase M16 [Dehalococcoides mccartyi]
MYELSVLPSGLRVISHHMPASRSVTICVYIGVGSRYETDCEAGASHFIEHMVFRGSKKYPDSQLISSAIEGVGGILNAATDRESTLYYAKVGSDKFALALDVLSDMLVTPLFNPEDLEKERKVIYEEISMSLDNPSHRVGLLLDEILWPNHPLGRDIAGTRQSVAGLDKQKLQAFMHSHYNPANIVVAVAGDIKHKSAVAAISQAFSGLGGKNEIQSFAPYHYGNPCQIGVDKRDAEQINLMLAMPGMNRLDDRRYAFSILNTILGDGMSSRLFAHVRDNLGLAYSVQSGTEFLHDTGAFSIYAAVDPANLTACVEAILTELESAKTTITAEELTKAKEMSKGRIHLAMEDSRYMAKWIGSQELLCRRVNTHEDVIRLIDGVSLKAVMELAGEYFRKPEMRLALVGPVDKEAVEGLLKG